MKYLMLIYDNEQAHMSMSPEEMSNTMALWDNYMDDLQKNVKVLAGEALQPTMTATTVRAGNPAPLATDGPFAETKEQLGGFFLIEATDLDDAIVWAGKMPHIASGGTVEIRPIMEFERESAG
ncbi:MAG: YciI family protein [Chloroflexi bacterium]|nr:YciI family protein [Chloroflexota bacterium]